MNWLLLCRLLGQLGILVGLCMVVSLPWAFPRFGQTQQFEEDGFWGLLAAMFCSVASGGVLYLAGRRESLRVVMRKEALAVVGLGWLYAGLLGSLPYVFSDSMRTAQAPMSFADALFESVSGFSTTGATVITDVEDHSTDPEAVHDKLIPRCVLFWRSFTQWLGGMGIIVLFVAVLGQLGVGGKALMRREVPGPIHESLRPRVRETAVVMWSIYMTLSLLLVLILLLEGMSLFDALCHSFATLATGGFSTHNASIGYFNNALIEWTIIAFMIIAGTNFSLYYMALRRPRDSVARGWMGRFSTFLRDPEFPVYLGILLASSLMLTISLSWSQTYDSLAKSARHAIFSTVSIMTTTGYGTEDFTGWSEFSKGLLLLLMFVGGCAGSTAGGMKVIRFVLFVKVVALEIEQAYRPNVVRPLRVAGVAIDKSHRHEVMVYFSLILMIFISSWMILAAIEPNDQWHRQGHTQSEKLIDCASAVATTLNNVGPGFGVLGPQENFSGFSTTGKLLLTLLMLLGRLELFAILVLFVPSFWKTQ